MISPFTAWLRVRSRRRAPPCRGLFPSAGPTHPGKVRFVSTLLAFSSHHLLSGDTQAQSTSHFVLIEGFRVGAHRRPARATENVRTGHEVRETTSCLSEVYNAW